MRMKRVLIFLVIAVLLGGVGGGAYLYYSGTAKNIISPKGEDTAAKPTPTPTLVTWDDPAGFSAQYPDGLTVNKHDEDKDNYAHVEFTNAAHPGGLIIWVKDLPKGITTTASWGKKMSASSSAILFDTTIGGQPAQKVLNSSPNKTVAVGAVYDGVLWTVETNLADASYWQSVHDTIVGSFTFKPVSTPAAAAAAPDASDQPVDEEEVIQ